jgi:tetratricopeptide (TPR) repeat protein
VHASNADRFEQGYREIAVQVELPGRDDPKTDILRAVHSWLCDERNGRWLMIVDNADDDRVFAAPGATGATGVSGGAIQALESSTEAETAAPLASFLPQAAHGWILVTSRDRVAAMNLVGARRNVVEVEPMGEQDALTLLKSKTPVDESSNNDARVLVETLEGIPLAITHAAAYIEVNRPMVDIAAYLELFRESEANQAHLLNDEKTRDLRRDASVSSAVITTWQLSFEQIRKTQPDAADLLSLMTMFDRQGIPEHVLYDGKTRLQFVEAVGPLFRFSLVRAQAGTQPDQPARGQLLEMHSLVQLATREWLQSRGHVEVWERASLRIVAVEFPSGQPETWAVCRTLLPHSIKLLSYSVEEDEKARLDRATMATNTGWYLMLIGEYGRAERMERSAVTTREEVLGPEHPDTLASMRNLAGVLNSQGKYEEAEAMERQTLAQREKVLGPEHPDTLMSMSNLALVLNWQGKYEEAEAMERQTLAQREKVLGPEHPDTLMSMSNLALVLNSQGKYEEAEAMDRQTLARSEKVLGPEHPDTLMSMNNLALALNSQGKYEEAEAMDRQTLAQRQKVLGPEHPDTLMSMSNLALALNSQGKYEEAEAMNRQTLAQRQKVLGPEHPDTLMSMSNLALALNSQGKYEEAEAMNRQTLAQREKVLGPEHPDTLTVMASLAFTLKPQGRSQEALLLMDACVRVQARVLGLGHPDSESSIATLNEWRLESLDVKA